MLEQERVSLRFFYFTYPMNFFAQILLGLKICCNFVIGIGG